MGRVRVRRASSRSRCAASASSSSTRSGGAHGTGTCHVPAPARAPHLMAKGSLTVDASAAARDSALSVVARRRSAADLAGASGRRMYATPSAMEHDAAAGAQSDVTNRGGAEDLPVALSVASAVALPPDTAELAPPPSVAPAPASDPSHFHRLMTSARARRELGELLPISLVAAVATPAEETRQGTEPDANS